LPSSATSTNFAARNLERRNLDWRSPKKWRRD
jgi:hypothetical protein